MTKRRDNVLLYERVKFLCGHTSYEAENEALLGMSHGTAVRLMKRIRDRGITLAEVQSTTPTALAEKYFSRANRKWDQEGDVRDQKFLQPDFALLSRELMLSKRHSGGTTNVKLEAQRRQLYEDVYCSDENRALCAQKGLQFYSMSHFYRLWRDFERRHVPPSFRRTEPPGAISEFDFTGVSMRCADGTKATFAVMVLDYSRMIYVEALPSQGTNDSATAIVNAFKFFGGVTETLRIDNFRAGVARFGRFGGELTDNFRMLSNFLGVEFSAMPPRYAWLKGSVEAAVKIVTHTLIARMKRIERMEGPFACIAQMNRWLREHLDLVNCHAVRGLGVTRKELFEQHEKAALHQVKSWDFRLSDTFTRTVGPTARLTVNGHEYAVPSNLMGRKVQVELKQSMVVVYEAGRPLCAYQRLDDVPGLSTRPGYTPPDHMFAEVLRATPNEMLMEWAQAIGPESLTRVKRLLRGNPSIDKTRRAARFLQLPRGNPDCYPVFEKFLRAQSSEIGVSRLLELWAQYPGRPDNSRQDEVYTFNRLFKIIEHRLYGGAGDLRWDSPIAERNTTTVKGRVFLNHGVPPPQGADVEPGAVGAAKESTPIPAIEDKP